MEFFDPHFHIWDLETPAPEGAGYPLASGHDATILFAPKGNKIHTTAEYEKQFESVSDTINHVGGAWVEAGSVCHVDMASSDPGYTAACLAEAKWTAAQLGTSSKKYVLVATMPLETENTAELLCLLTKIEGVKGIRQIVNAKPDWPRNGKFDDLLDNAAWQKGYAELAKVGFSFDLQLNPPQYLKAAAVITKTPEVPVIINHLGCPTLDDLTERGDDFFAGMEAMAAASKDVYIKISMLCYITPEWDQNQLVVDAVHRIIKIFGTSRCFFASNYPVDVKDGWPAPKLFAAFKKLASQYDDDVQKGLFAGNAKTAYRV